MTKRQTQSEMWLQYLEAKAFVPCEEGVRVRDKTFPLNDAGKKRLVELVGDGAFVLQYMGGSDKLGKKILALDLLVQGDRFGMNNVRMLGDPNEIPMAQGFVRCEVMTRAIHAPRMPFEISVVEHEGEKLFSFNDTLFDSLACEYDYLDGALSVIRDGALFDKTMGIEIYGTHGASPCFMGLEKIFADKSAYSYAVGALEPAEFEVADTLVLEIPVPLGAEPQFAQFIRARASIQAAMTRAFEEKNPLTMDELGEKLARGVAANKEEFDRAEVVRFKK